MATKENQIQVHKEREKAVIQQLTMPAVIPTLAKFLPKSLDAARVVRQTITLVRKTPGLGECDPFTVLAGMIQAAELGFELSAVLGHAWLVPRYNSRRKVKEAVFQIGVKGYKKLAFNTGRVLSFRAECVWLGDMFDYCYGTQQFLRHRPCGKEEGQPTHFYAYAMLQNSGEDFCVMTREQVETWRQRYAPPPLDKPDLSAWASNFNGMALKTVSGIVARRLPHAVHVEEILKLEGSEDEEATLGRQVSPMAELALADLGVQPEKSPAEQVAGEISDADFEVSEESGPAASSQGKSPES